MITGYIHTSGNNPARKCPREIGSPATKQYQDKCSTCNQNENQDNKFQTSKRVFW